MNETELYVVHSSFGRLRVHLPDPGREVVAHLRGLAGVTSAEANDLTGNILILYAPKHTTEQNLLAELAAQRGDLQAAAPAPSPLALVQPASAPTLPVMEIDVAAGAVGLYATGLRRSLYQVLGWSSMGMAVVGAILPGVPTVPFVILASYFFIRSSPEAHAWLRRLRWFGQLLRDWEDRRGVTRPVKFTAVGLIAVAMVVIWFTGLPTSVIVSILALEFIGLIMVLRLPVVEAAPAQV